MVTVDLGAVDLAAVGLVDLATVDMAGVDLTAMSLVDLDTMGLVNLTLLMWPPWIRAPSIWPHISGRHGSRGSGHLRYGCH